MHGATPWYSTVWYNDEVEMLGIMAVGCMDLQPQISMQRHSSPASSLEYIPLDTTLIGDRMPEPQRPRYDAVRDPLHKHFFEETTFSFRLG